MCVLGIRYHAMHRTIKSKTSVFQVASWQHGIGIKDMQLEPPVDRDKEKPLNSTMIVTTIIASIAI